VTSRRMYAGKMESDPTKEKGVTENRAKHLIDSVRYLDFILANKESADVTITLESQKARKTK